MPAWPLVGRDEERSLALRSFDDPRGRGLVLAGQPGVGKSRLAADVLAELGERGCDIESGASTQSTSTVPFGLFAHLARKQEGAPSRTDILVALTQAISERAHEAPVILHVDDAHLVDDGTAAFIHAVCAQGSARLLLTLRSGEPAPDAITALWKENRLDRLDLQPLAAADVDRLIEEAMHGPVEAGTRQRLRRWCAGNPLLLREVLLAGSEAGTLGRVEGVWHWKGDAAIGDRLATVIHDRLNDVSEDERQVLASLALAEPLDPAWFIPFGGFAALESLERRGLVTSAQSPDGRTQVRLGHPLYGDLMKSRLSSLMRSRVLLTLSDEVLRHPTAAKADDVFRAVVWRTDAGAATDPQLLISAAERALALFEPALTGRLAARAIESGGGDRARLLLGHALYWSDDYDGCLRQLDLVRPGRSSDGDASEAAIVRSSAVLWGFDDADGAQAEVHGTLRALRDRGASAALRGQLASVLVWSGHPVEAARLASEILEDAGAGSSAHIRALVPLVLSRAVDGETAQVVAVTAEWFATAASGMANHPLVAGELLAVQAAAHWLGGDLHAASTLAAQITQWCLDNNDDTMRGVFTLISGQTMLHCGNVEAAIRELREAVALLVGHDPAGALGWGYGTLAGAYAQSGDERPARQAADMARRHVREATHILTPLIELGEAWALAAEGMTSAAVDSLLDTVLRITDRGMRAVELLLLTEATRLGGAAAAADRLSILARELSTPRAVAAHELALGILRDDPDLLARASTSFEGAGAQLTAAEAASLAARAYRQSGRRAPSSAAAQRARSLLARCSQAHTPLLTATDDFVVDALSRREREVANLAVRQLTSRTIADRLGLSERTIENHLSRAYAKLGVRNREQLAAVLAEAETIPQP